MSKVYQKLLGFVGSSGGCVSGGLTRNGLVQTLFSKLDGCIIARDIKIFKNENARHESCRALEFPPA